MAPNAAKRLTSELSQIQKKMDSLPYVKACAPEGDDLFKWNASLSGPEGSPYEGGTFNLSISFPQDFPFKPPSIYMLTPNGRFETDRRLCLSMSDFHPETWVPTWSVATILNGVLSFMVETSPTTGSVETSLETKHKLRRESAGFNARSELFCKLFPDLVGGKLFTDPAALSSSQARDCARSIGARSVGAG